MIWNVWNEYTTLEVFAQSNKFGAFVLLFNYLENLKTCAKDVFQYLLYVYWKVFWYGIYFAW
jgi:hypothetical protein